MKRAQSQTRNQTPGLAPENARARVRLFSHQEQAAPRRAGSRRAGLKFAYIGRKNKKRDFRSLWIVRINAACREAGISYSKFMHGLKAAGVELDRKVLAELAMQDAAAFRLLIDRAKGALEKAG